MPHSQHSPHVFQWWFREPWPPAVSRDPIVQVGHWSVCSKWNALVAVTMLQLCGWKLWYIHSYKLMKWSLSMLQPSVAKSWVLIILTCTQSMYTGATNLWNWVINALLLLCEWTMAGHRACGQHFHLPLTHDSTSALLDHTYYIQPSIPLSWV